MERRKGPTNNSSGRTEKMEGPLLLIAPVIGAFGEMSSDIQAAISPRPIAVGPPPGLRRAFRALTAGLLRPPFPFLFHHNMIHIVQFLDCRKLY